MRLLTFYAWKIVMAQYQAHLPPLILLSFYDHFDYHGFESWTGYKEKFTTAYFPREDL